MKWLALNRLFSFFEGGCTDSLFIQPTLCRLLGGVYESNDHQAPRGHVRQARRHPALTPRVSKASALLQLVAVSLCHKDYDFITLERRGRVRKENSLHSSVNVHLKLLRNQSPAKINRECLGVVVGGAGYASEI